MPGKKSFLQNLISTSKKTAIKFDAKDASLNSRRCPNCKAARPDDEDICFCSFCGFQFIKLDEEIKLNSKKTG